MREIRDGVRRWLAAGEGVALKLWKEISQFVAARVFSGAGETLMLLVVVDMMGYPDSIIKIIAGILVIIVNYLFSKWIIFKKA